MHVHIRQARLDKYSQEAAPSDNGPHDWHLQVELRDLQPTSVTIPDGLNCGIDEA